MYRTFGIFLIAITFLTIIIYLFSQIIDVGPLTRGYGSIDYVYEVVVEGLSFSIMIFILGFFPGLFYYRLSSKTGAAERIVRIGFFLKVLSFIVMVLVGGIAFFSCMNGCDGVGEAILLMLFGVPAAIMYGIGVLLLIVHKYQMRDFTLGRTEKNAIIILVLAGVLVAVVFIIVLLMS